MEACTVLHASVYTCDQLFFYSHTAGILNYHSQSHTKTERDSHKSIQRTFVIYLKLNQSYDNVFTIKFTELIEYVILQSKVATKYKNDNFANFKRENYEL